MNKSIFITLIALSLLAFGCGGTEQPTNSAAANSASEESESKAEETVAKPESKEVAGLATPTDAVNTFVEGVRAKDEAKMRSALSKATLEKFDAMAKDEKKSFYEIVVGEDYEEMSKQQEMRNEKIDGEKATVEIKSDKTGDWGPMPLVKEDGGWKIALYDNAPKVER